MDKFSINDWLTIQTRKDLTFIRRSLEHESINYAIFADLFIALFSFVMNHVLWTITDETTGIVEQVAPSWYWIGTAALLVIVPAIIFIWKCLKRKRYQADSKMVMPVEYLVDLFDNEICYNVMTADSMRDHMLDASETIEEEIQKFYFIEALYYTNKTVTQLFYFKNPGQNAIQTDRSSGGVASIRFRNVCEIVFNIYMELIEFADNKSDNQADNKSDYQVLIENSRDYIFNFNDLLFYMGSIDELKDMIKWKVKV